ncbi:MAG: response regulator [Rhodospirillales bacterium]
MDTGKPHILVVDDDDRLRDLLRDFLSANGFIVTTAGDAAEARTRRAVMSFDLIVLDLMMPGESGLEYAAGLRKSSPVPILMLTAMGEPEQRIAGLETGADDYMAKPFEPRELLLRINSILRRIPREAVEGPGEVNLGEVRFDLVRDELSRSGEPIRLTEIEAALLRALAENPGVTLSREDLMRRTGASGGGRAIDVQVTRLRRKIEKDPKLPRYLQTVRGKGYLLRPD